MVRILSRCGGGYAAVECGCPQFRVPAAPGAVAAAALWAAFVGCGSPRAWNSAARFREKGAAAAAPVPPLLLPLLLVLVVAGM